VFKANSSGLAASGKYPDFEPHCHNAFYAIYLRIEDYKVVAQQTRKLVGMLSK
jgi:hypothetical protein